MHHRHSFSRPVLALALLTTSACDERPTAPPASGTLSGHVIATSPVAGAVVTAYALDLSTGERGDILGQSEPTLDDGSYVIELEVYAGPVVLEARGPAAAYVEPASGAEAGFEAQTRLRAVVVAWDDAGVNLQFGVDVNEQRTDAVISPFTELAVGYADARTRVGLSPSWDTAIEDSVLIWHSHLELDYWRVVPRALTDTPVGPWDERVHAGVLYAGLSQLARRVAVESSLSPAAVSSVSVLDALSLDLTDGAAKLDGVGPGSPEPIRLGACPEPAAGDPLPICTLSGRTLRGHWAESVALFLADDTVNASGLTFSDTQQLMERIALRSSPLFPPPDSQLDTAPPVIAIDGVADTDLVSGTVAFRVTATDAVQMDAITAIAVARDPQTWTDGDGTGVLTVTHAAPDPRTRVADVVFASSLLSDGAVVLGVDAVDAEGNERTLSWTLFSDNTGAGTIAGTVTIGGRVTGAEVVAFDATGGGAGPELGRTTTDADGLFSLSVAEAPLVTSVGLVARKPAGETATYVETSSGATIELSPDDTVEAVIADWVDGDSRNVQITPWTTMAARLARGLYDSGYEATWIAAVDTAHEALEAHVADGGPAVDLRTVRPADMTDPDEVTTLNAQVRYGLMVAGLGELADAHAFDSAQSPVSMNTMTLTKKLAADLGADGAAQPLFDGRTAAGPIVHGVVVGTSYWTRVDLAVGIVRFIEENPFDASALTEFDVLALLDRIATDENPQLYAEPGLPYDLIAPVVAFDDTVTPAEGTPVRGTVALRATATDNRKLLREPTPDAGLAWTAPATGLGGVVLSGTAMFDGPWTLDGQLDTTALPEGPVAVVATASDEAFNETTATRTLVVDRTPPDVVVGTIAAGGAALADGDITGADTLVVTGTVLDAHGVAAASYSWNASPATVLLLAGDGTWSLTLPLSPGGNTLSITATDIAGNVRAGVSVSVERDATPPVVLGVTGGAAAQMEDEVTYVVSITGPGAGAVNYVPTASTVPNPITDGTSFSKYAPRYYDTSQPNLPQWRYTVSDDRTDAGAIAVEFRIRRGADLIVDWTPAPPIGATGYNRAITISGALAPALGQQSGTFSIDVRATDTFGNTSAPATASWTQTILPTPMVFSAAVLGAVESAPERLPRYYTLDDTPNATGWPANNFSGLLTSSGPHGGSLRIAKWRIANPNPIPIRVQLADVTVPIGYRSGRILRTPIHDDAHMLDGPCYTTRQHLSATAQCYLLALLPGGPTFDETIKSGDVSNLATGLEVVSVGGAALAPCADCAASEWELPAGFEGSAYATSGVFSFLDERANEMMDIGSIGSPAIENITGIPNSKLTSPGAFFRQCDDTKLVAGILVCDTATEREALRSITRVEVTFAAATATLRARAGTAGPAQTAALTATDQPAGTRDLRETETGFAPFD